MKTAIVYASKKGTTEKVARLIAEKIKENNNVTLINLKKNHHPNLSGFEKIILGSPIYMGRAQKRMRFFYQDNKKNIEHKIIGLYICCMFLEPQKQTEQLKMAYPDWLHKKAIAEGMLGGEFLFDKLNFFEKIIIKKVSQIENSTSHIDFDAIDNFAKKIN